MPRHGEPSVSPHPSQFSQLGSQPRNPGLPGRIPGGAGLRATPRPAESKLLTLRFYIRYLAYNFPDVATRDGPPVRTAGAAGYLPEPSPRSQAGPVSPECRRTYEEVD